LYWEIGKYISEQTQKEGWGKGTVSQLAAYIQTQEPDSKGFTDKNLWRMKQFYETYANAPKLATLWRELSWSLNRLIFPLKSEEERTSYLPGIGILLCKGKDSEVVEYALSRNLSPALVSEYQMALPDKKLLQAKLHELVEMWEDQKGREE
jgi:hypothetical protein